MPTHHITKTMGTDELALTAGWRPCSYPSTVLIDFRSDGLLVMAT